MITLSSFPDGANFGTLPDHYILRRWTKKAKEGLGISIDQPTKNSNFTQHYQYLTYKMNYLATLVSLDWESVKEVDEFLNKLITRYSRRATSGKNILIYC